MAGWGGAYAACVGPFALPGPGRCAMALEKAPVRVEKPQLPRKDTERGAGRRHIHFSTRHLAAPRPNPVRRAETAPLHGCQGHCVALRAGERRMHMEALPSSPVQTDLLAERAMRQTATILRDLTTCRRRACRRNGCCGPLAENAGKPSRAKGGFSHIPPCITGIDVELVAVFEEQSCLLLAFLSRNPDYKLHPARLR